MRVHPDFEEELLGFDLKFSSKCLGFTYLLYKEASQALMRTLSGGHRLEVKQSAEVPYRMEQNTFKLYI